MRRKISKSRKKKSHQCSCFEEDCKIEKKAGSLPANFRSHVDLASKKASQRKMKGCTIRRQRKREYLSRGKSPLRSEAALFNFTQEVWSVRRVIFIKVDVLSLFLSRSFSVSYSLPLPTTYILSFFAPGWCNLSSLSPELF